MFNIRISKVYSYPAIASFWMFNLLIAFRASQTIAILLSVTFLTLSIIASKKVVRYFQKQNEIDLKLEALSHKVITQDLFRQHIENKFQEWEDERLIPLADNLKVLADDQEKLLFIALQIWLSSSERHTPEGFRQEMSRKYKSKARF